MIRKWMIVFATLVAFVVTPVAVHAAVRCTISTVGVAFGIYDVFSSAPLHSAGSVTVRCVGLGRDIELVSVALNTGGSGSFQPRRLFRGSDTMNYNLYLDAGHSQIWGDGTGGTLKHDVSVSNNRPAILTIFGRIPPGQDVSAGAYSDTIVVTVNF